MEDQKWLICVRKNEDNRQKMKPDFDLKNLFTRKIKQLLLKVLKQSYDIISVILFGFSIFFVFTTFFITSTNAMKRETSSFIYCTIK